MTAVALAARNLVVRRRDASGEFELRVQDLDLASGEVLAVLGRNGAGKSTLLRALAGLESLAGGRVDQRVSGATTMVFQRPVVFAGSVEHNLRAALLGLRLSREAAAERSRHALDRFGIARLAKRRAASLSGGEKRRLALARAFALRPAVLLLDEPFDDLDASAQESLSIDLRDVIAETGVAVAVVTHDLRRALLLADRIAVLQNGRLTQCDAREQVLRRPLDPGVAMLVGMSNLVAGEVSLADERVVVAIGADHRIPVPTSHPPGTPVWLGIRPEHIEIDVDSRAGIAMGEGRVLVVSDGVAVAVALQWAGTELRTHLIAGRGLARRLAAGDAVALSVRPEDVHLMERRTESRGDAAADGGEGARGLGPPF